MTTTVHFRDPELYLDGEWDFWTGSNSNIGEGVLKQTAKPEDTNSVTVPHAWQECSDLREYTGIGWYQRTFEYDEYDEDSLVHLVFKAVDFESTVWVNGKKVGTDQQGYLPFSFDITDVIEPGENSVTVQVCDPKEVSELPHGKQGDPWYTRVSGPWQQIKVVTLPDVFIQSVRVTPNIEDDTARFDVTIGDERGLFNDTKSDYTLTISVFEEGDYVVSDQFILNDTSTTATIQIPDPDYWCPDNPVLYDFEINLQESGDEIDTYEHYFGMRSISYSEGEIYLNGERFYIRGALDQGYYPGGIYRPEDTDIYKKEIQLAKEMGFNLLRKHIKPAHPEFIEAADRLGILVWEEPANPKRYTQSSKRRMVDQLERLIQRDYNNPSVVIWSIYNEEWGIGSADEEDSLWEDEEKQQHLGNLYRQVQELDSTRLVCDNSGWAHVATDINDYHEYFITPDRVTTWRNRLDEIINSPESNYSNAQTDPQESPIVISEFGTWGLSKLSRLYNHYDGDPPWFEHSFLTGIKDPKGVRSRFQASHTSTVFESLDEVATAWQTRQFQSLKTTIADIRTRNNISGYVITELSDTEWEFNGILNYLRERKSFSEELKRVNSPVMVKLEPSSNVVWSGETVTVTVKIANDTLSAIKGDITVRAAGQTSTHTVQVSPTDSVSLSEGLSFKAPSVKEISTVELMVNTDISEDSVKREIFVVPSEESTRAATVWTPHSELRESIRSRGHTTVNNQTTADVAIVSDPTITELPAILIPNSDGSLNDSRWFSGEPLPEGESWNLCASFVYQNALANINPVPGWAFSNIYPHWYITDTQASDDVLVGYTEGWLKNNGAFAMIRSTESESVGACTFPVIESYNDHPILTALFDRMIERFV